jgi:hypothetical protein
MGLSAHEWSTLRLELNWILSLDYKVSVPKYDINNTRLVRLTSVRQESELSEFFPEVLV